MKRPLFRLLMTTDAVGGVWQYSVDLARALADLHIETVLAVLGPSPPRGQIESVLEMEGVRLLDTGLSLDWLAEDAASIINAGNAVADLAEAAKVDIVQLNNPALAAGTIFTVPLVAVQHSCVASWWEAVHASDLPADFAWRTDLVRAGLRAANAVVTPTAAFGEVTERIYELEETPLTVHNGRKPLPLRSGASHDFVFTAGRLWDEGKNLATIDAAAGGLGVPLHAAGPLRGPNGTAVLFDNIHSLGTLDEVELGRWLAARPVFVSASLYEPFGLAVLEAATAGCPLVLSDIPTFRELWDGAAIFVPPREENGFARAIGDLVGDDSLRASLGATAQERAARYTPAAMAAQMANIYRHLLPAVERPVLAAKVAA
jgi:glycosyltransferase involved in cell wall biosynthesis